MVVCSGSLYPDAHSVPGGTDELGDEDAATVVADAAAIPLVPRDATEVVFEDSERGGSTLDRHNHHTAAELVGEDKHVIVAVVIISHGVEVHRHDLPRVPAVTREMELTSGHAVHLRTGTRVALPDVVIDIALQAGPIVKT